MIEFIKLYVIAIILWIFVYKTGKVIFDRKNMELSIKTIFMILLFSISTALLNTFDSKIIGGIIKILCVYILFCLFYKIIFKSIWKKNFTASLILYLAICASEAVIGFIGAIILNMLSLPMTTFNHSIVANVLIVILEYFIIIILGKKLSTFVKNDSYTEKSSIAIVTIILITLALLGFKRPMTNWKLDIEFIVTMIMLLGFCIIGIYLLKQRSDIQKTSSMYNQVVRYSNTTNKLLEDYRMVNHEHKNQLSIIRQMVKDNKVSELIDYIDNLIDKRNDIKYKWAADLNNLPLDGLRGLINYKLLEMEDNKIDITVSISKEIIKFKNKLNKLNTKEKDNLYSIMGVYLDNAIDATLKNKKRIIGLDIYKESKDIIIVLSNTYSGKIDIKKIDEYGYSTKGKNHGIGLHIVKNILDNSKLFSQKRDILKEFYIQELRIHTNEIK